MSVDYGEIICTAVDEIVNAKLEGLQYDITKLCMVVDDSQRHKGEYVVSDGNARFQAFSTDTSFRNNNNVLVVIPNGDFRMQKTITGRVAATNTEPFKYTSPMDTMVNISGNVFEGATDNAASLLANGIESADIIIKILEVGGDSLVGLTGFTRLGVTANFRSWLQGLDVVQGTYGLKIFITSENNRYDLTFNNNDMYGNPYQFEDYFYQEKVFDISIINKIDKVEVYFYQNRDFKNGIGQDIAHELSATEGLEAQTLSDNLFVKDVAIYFGYDISAFSGETLSLVSEDKLTYTYKNEGDENIVEPVDLKLQWIHKVNDNEYALLEQEKDINSENSNYEIHWFRYNEGHKEVNHYAGIGWESITPTIKQGEKEVEQLKSLTLEGVSLDPEKPYEEFKAVGVIKETINDKEVKNTYVSNVLKFVNEKYTNEVLINKSGGYAIEFDDGSQGNYFLYDQNGNILNAGLGQGYKRTARVTYRGGELPLDNEVDYIFWYLPQETSSNPAKTMLTYSTEYLAENEGKYKNNANGDWLYRMLDCYGTDYVGVKRDNGNITQSFSIGNHWNQQKTNNTIRCIISIKGIEYELASELKFGRAGTQGTNTTMILEFVDNENAFIIGNNKCKIECILYDFNGVRLNSNSGTYNWSWLGYDNDNSEKDKKIVNPCFNSFENQSNKIITLEQKDTIGDNLTQNYSILQCIYSNNNEEKLTAYLPIPIKADKKIESNEENKEEIIKSYSHIEGAREVIYNHQGIPNYYDDVYKLYKTTTTVKKENDKVINSNSKIESIPASWSISNSINGMKFPCLKDLMRAGETYQALVVEPFYMQSDNKTCVYATVNDKVVWSQPILIMQSKYDFAMLNNWDGGLTFDENNGTILSTMLGAGRKNDDNTFSGVLIGDIKDGTQLNNTETLTGVYGFNNGVISYALKEDGTATFGEVGRGQIKIDGNESTIKSGNYDINNKGMLIDLDDGIIDIKAKENFYYQKIGFIEEDKFEQQKYYYINENKEYILETQWNSEKEYYIKAIDQSSIYISPDNNIAYLQIRDKKGNILMNVNDQNYYLQSGDYDFYDGKDGTYFDLDDGKLIIKNKESGSISLNNDSTLFEVKEKNEQTLINMSNDSYYLQSAGYTGQTIATLQSDTSYELYNNPNMKSFKNGEDIITASSIIALKKENNNIKVYNTSPYSYIKVSTPVESECKEGLYYINSNEGKDEKPNYILATEWKQEGIYYKKENIIALGNEIIFEDTTINKNTGVKDENDENTTIEQSYTSDEYKNYFILQLNPCFKETIQSGLKIDLENGYIKGYDVRIQGTNSKDTSQYFTLDSSAETTPLTIGNKFKVNWDGTLYCDNIQYLGTKVPSGDTIIEINKAFYVNSGGAGGSSANFDTGYFGGGYFGGTSAKVKLDGTGTTYATVDADGKVAQGRHNDADIDNLILDVFDIWAAIDELTEKVSELEKGFDSHTHAISKSDFDHSHNISGSTGQEALHSHPSGTLAVATHDFGTGDFDTGRPQWG